MCIRDRSDVDALFHKQATVLADQRGKMFETFTIGFRSPVDIQVIGIGRSNNGHIRFQPMERTVELVQMCIRDRSMGSPITDKGKKTDRQKRLTKLISFFMVVILLYVSVDKDKRLPPSLSLQF